ncbi:HLH-domain-containing protein [Ganoderma leucocontextum]|nr:HLH-domain-containing protein [Ganoderma leucocontextum]
MSSAFYPSYKPQVLSRTEGFHLPSPPPSNSPPSPPAPSHNSANTSNQFDNLFVPPLFSVPDSFRKFPSHSSDQSANNMDFTDELASLIATSPSQGHPHNSSHERSTQSPGAYDDYRSHHTHNIFDISAPTSHHQSSHHNHFNHQNPSFSLPPASSLHSNNLHTPSSVHNPHPLHEFTAHSHFNSTVPAIGSSMRYEPPSNNPSSPVTANGNNPFSGAEPSSFSSHMSNISGISSFSNITAPSEFHLSQASNAGQTNGQRQTPSPVSANGAAAEFSRSRSRSRAPSSLDPANPPSTNGGPARRTRPKRNSVSSVSPPPLHRGHTQPLVIPNGANGAGRGPASPLSLHTGGWFMPGGQGNEFGLPTPESVHGFTAFNGGTSLGSVGLGVSPKEVNVPGMGMVGMQKGESPPEDLASKQALIANEKRRRRRESHNAVERRRRDNINEKISELATLIPECLLDPNGPEIATMTLPASLSAASGEDLLFGVTITNPPEKKEGSGSAEPEDPVNSGSTPTTTTGGSAANGVDGNSIVKANKGMILRKSVEYIHYLQQLVSAQANRNRDLEQQLQAFRGESATDASSVSGDGDGEMKLHDEVGFALLNGDAHANGATHAVNGRARRGSIRKTYTFSGDLPSVGEEMDQDEHADGDQEMERPSTAGTGTGVSPGSSIDDDIDDDGEDGEDGEDDEDMEIERGRKGRDGRPVGVGKRVGRKAKSVSVGEGVKVKKETDRVDGMEIS